MADKDRIVQFTKDVGAEVALMLMDTFKTDVDKRITSITHYIDGQKTDIAELRLQAHSLKGLCRTFGALDGAEHALALEVACDGGDETDIQTKAQQAAASIPSDVQSTLTLAKELAKGI